MDQEIHKFNAIVHNLWKIWRVASSGTGSYGLQAGKHADKHADKIWAWFEILKACFRSKY